MPRKGSRTRDDVGSHKVTMPLEELSPMSRTFRKTANCGENVLFTGGLSEMPRWTRWSVFGLG